MTRDEIFERTQAGSRFGQSASVSAKTGVPPAYKIDAAVALNVYGLVITSSPGFRNAWPMNSMISFEPLPRMMFSRFTPSFSAIAFRRAQAPPSG